MLSSASERLKTATLELNKPDLIHEFRAKLEEYIKATDRPIAIILHQKIDKDCYGAGLAMLEYIRSRYPEKTVNLLIFDDRDAINNQKINIDDSNENVIWAGEDINTYVAEAGLFIMVDNPDLTRSGLSTNEINNISSSGTPVVVIDHHPEIPKSSSDFFQDKTASSTSEIVTRLFGNTQIPKHIAIYLLSGVLSDTSGLRYVNADGRERTEEVVKMLCESGELTPAMLIEMMAVRMTDSEKIYAEKISKTKRTLSVPKFPEDVVVAIYDEETLPNEPELDKSKVTTMLLDWILKDNHQFAQSQFIKETLARIFPDEESADFEADWLKEQDQFLADILGDIPPADYSVFLKPVKINEKKLMSMKANGYVGSVGDTLIEIKMRSSTLPIANAVGQLLHRGGHNKAAMGEVWLTPAMTKSLNNSESYIKNVLAMATREFVRKYTKVKKT